MNSTECSKLITETFMDGARFSSSVNYKIKSLSIVIHKLVNEISFTEILQVVRDINVVFQHSEVLRNAAFLGVTK